MYCCNTHVVPAASEGRQSIVLLTKHDTLVVVSEKRCQKSEQGPPPSQTKWGKLRSAAAARLNAQNKKPRQQKRCGEGKQVDPLMPLFFISFHTPAREKTMRKFLDFFNLQ